MNTKTKISTISVVLLLLGAFTAQSAVADGDAERGASIGYSCLGCHGIEGYRNAYPSYRVPKLGGQKASYLINALTGYRDGARPHPTMQAQATSLSDQEIQDVAAYLSGIGGETVAEGGDSTAGIEATSTCVACHGQNGISLSPTWPTLAGQHEDYLVHAMNQYRDGTRTDLVMSPMAAALTEDDVLLLARFYSRLSGLETTQIK